MNCIRCGRDDKFHYARGMCHACYHTWRTRQVAYGRFENVYVPAEPVIEHLQKLREAGMGYARIAELSGVGRRTLQKMAQRHGASPTCHQGTANRVLAVELPHAPFGAQVADGAQIAAVGTVRRLRALAAAGYTITELASRLDTDFQLVSVLQRGEQQKVTARLARKVARVFTQLEMTPGVSQPARSRAQRFGWASPFAWDEDTIDNPSARPRVPMLKADDWLPEYEKLSAKGYPKKRIAALMGIEECSLNTRLRRARAA